MDTEKSVIETAVEEKDDFTQEKTLRFGYEELNEPGITIKDDGDFHFRGLPSQRQAYLEDWSKYIGEVQNPYTNASNTFLKKPDGTASLYAPLDEVLNRTRPVLSKYGFGLTQIPRAETGKVSVQTMISHKGGAYMIYPSLTMPVVKNDPQTLIAGITYARRGSLNPILATHGEKDEDGNGLGADGKGKKPETPKSTPEDVVTKQKLVISLAKELIDGGTDREKVNSTLETTCQSKNPNSVKDIKLLDAAYTALDKIRADKKVGK